MRMIRWMDDKALLMGILLSLVATVFCLMTK